MSRMMDALLRARALTLDVTPLNTDCGRCCGHACCQPDETGKGGMLLFPAEEKLYLDRPGFTISPYQLDAAPVLLLTCDGHCERAERPLGCRLFPLLPKLKNGQVRVVRDRRGFERCPLLPDGLTAFRPDFVEAVRAAGKALYQTEEHRFFLDRLHAFIDTFQL